VLSRLLAAPVVPLDYAAYAEALLTELDRLAAGLTGRLDLSLLLSGAAALGRNARALAEADARASDAQARRLDRALLRASRSLVPINYTTGERFHHDPALPQPPWPALAALRALAARDATDPDLPFTVTHARQTRNRVAFALREANRNLSDALAPIPFSSGDEP
jgi:hypothetical protein